MINYINSYNEQVKPFKNSSGKWEQTRADKKTRYFMHELSKDENLKINEKFRWSIDLLKIALNRSSKPVVSCSFGIDSVLTLYLTRVALSELGKNPSDIDVVWNDTLNEFHEVRKYACDLRDEWDLRLVVSKPKKPLKKIIDDNGGITSDYFTARKGSRKNGQPLSEKCCGTLKHEPMRRAIKENKWDLVINGLRSDESRQRLLAGLRDGDFFYSSHEWKALVIRPILWWKEKEIWEFVEEKKIPYNDLYKKNLIQKYPNELESVIKENLEGLKRANVDVEKLSNQQIQTVTRLQAITLEKIGFKIFTPRTGCQMCPIPIKYGYMQWMRLYYPKVYNAMVHNLGYGKVLIEMIPKEVKEEIEELTGLDLTAESAIAHLKEILISKPCAFDDFGKKG